MKLQNVTDTRSPGGLEGRRKAVISVEVCSPIVMDSSGLSDWHPAQHRERLAPKRRA